MPHTPIPSPALSARSEDLILKARAARGFMPDDEGLALFQAALRAGAADPGTARSGADAAASPSSPTGVS